MTLAPADPDPKLPAPLAATTAPPRRLRTGAAGAVVAGFVILLLAFGGFGTWAALAPLSSAAIAPGIIVVEGSRKTVQHLEGGIIKEILVAEGSRVAAGEVLVRLDETRPRTQYELLRGEYLAAIALAARLKAERDDYDSIPFSAELLGRRDEPQVMDIMVGQQRLFDARRTALRGQIEILRQRIAQYGEEIRGLEAQQQAKGQQIALIHEELRAVQELFEKGHERKPRLLALKRASARLKGERGEHIADISRVKQAIGEAELRIIDLSNTFQREVATELREVQRRVSELTERMTGQEDVLRRLEIRAPHGGVVVDLKVHTTDGVIAPRMPILDIVPIGDNLIVEAQVKPEDIDVVHPGLLAQARLTAYGRRTTPTVAGEVVHVSADRFVNERSGTAYYMARVVLDATALAALDDVELYPGMPAEVMIETGQRTAFDYLLSPITRGMERAFREQ